MPQDRISTEDVKRILNEYIVHYDDVVEQEFNIAKLIEEIITKI